MTPAPWPRSLLPADRDHRWNQMLDYLANEYRALEPDDQLLGVYLGIRDGHGQGWAVVRIEGNICRIPVSDEWLEGAGT